MKNVFVLFLFVCVACNNNSPSKKAGETNFLMHIKIDKSDFSKLKPLLMSDLVDSIRYIQLETSPECFLPTEGGRLTLSGNLIFSAYRYKLYQFDTKGNFIRQIGREGKGPGEFALAGSRYSIDEANKKIFVISRYSDCPLEFDFDGNYLGNMRDSTLVSCQQIISRFEVSNGFFIFVPYPGDSKSQMICKPYELLLYDYVNRKIVQSLTNRMDCKTDHVHWDVNPGLQVLQKQGDQCFYKSFYNDTLYIISDGQIHPHAVVDLGNRKYPADLLYSSDPFKPRPGRIGKILITYMFLHQNYLLFGCTFINDDNLMNSSGFICKYDLKTNIITYHHPYITNDWDGGANISMYSFSKGIRAVPFPDETMENKHIFFSNMNMEDLKYPELKGKFEQMQQRRKENDNPLLMTWRLK